MSDGTLATTAKQSTAEAVRQRVKRSNERFWRPADFVGSHGAVLKTLERLVDDRELRRIRRGLYWRGRTTLLGMAAPGTQRLVGELFGTAGIGPAGWSAALALGLSTQHPNRDIVAVPSRPPRSVGAHVELKNRSSRQGRASSKLNWWEVALLEVLTSFGSVVELPEPEAVERLSEWLLSEKVRPKKLAEAARTEPPVVREGLRSLMVHAGLNEQSERIPPARSEHVRTRALAAA